MEQPAKMDLTSMNISEDKREQLRQLFPEVFTEKAVDFEKLKLVLGEMIDTGKERYGLNWAGKADCFKIIQQPSVGTLKPCRDESVNFDETENIFIEGDNLEVLKLLQKAYYGKVKMICIDPPYNTGNDFIYPDDYSESLDTYLKYTRQIDSEGRKYSTNTEADGRFHTKWINMMYPRLYLARNLMRDDGVIFINIDDHELANLRKICDEIFGEENFVESFIWRSRLGKGSTSTETATIHEYVVCYARSIEHIDFLPDIRTKNKDSKERLRQWGQGDKREDRPSMYFPIHSQEYGEVYPIRSDGTDGRWRASKSKVDLMLKNDLLIFEKQNDGRVEVYRKILSGSTTSTAQDSMLDTEVVKTTAHGSKEILSIFQGKIFDYPKPTLLFTHFLKMVNDDIAVILDFFAGSATTAHAVIELNMQDNGNRKFIMVQLPEPCDTESEAFKAGYKNIADIGKERIRRVIKKIKEEQGNKLEYDESKQDLGFRVLKLDHSNFKIWDADTAGDAQKIGEQLALHVDHIDPKSTQEDILYELLLKSGFDLATKTEKITLAGKTVYSIADGAMLICLEEKLTKEVINAIAEMTPSRVICLDKGFKDNDQLKSNAVQIMKSKKVNTFLTV